MISIEGYSLNDYAFQKIMNGINFGFVEISKREIIIDLIVYYTVVWSISIESNLIANNRQR